MKKYSRPLKNIFFLGYGLAMACAASAMVQDLESLSPYTIDHHLISRDYFKTFDEQKNPKGLLSEPLFQHGQSAKTDGLDAQNRPVLQDFEIFTEKIRSNIDWISRKRMLELFNRLFQVAGAPIFDPNPVVGLTFGVRIETLEINEDLDSWNNLYIIQVVNSGRGKRDHFFSYFTPSLWGKKHQLKVEIKLVSDPAANYFGVGNETLNNVHLIDPLNTQFQSSNYYRYILERESLNIYYLLDLAYPNHFLQFRTGYIRNNSNVFEAQSTLFQKDLMNRFSTADYAFVGLGYNFDSRDSFFNPRHGIYADVAALAYLNTLHNSVPFFRNTASLRVFKPIWGTFFWAMRGIVDWVYGDDVPFYELGQLGGFFPTQGLGGSELLRGFSSFRFIDRIKFSLQNELRLDFYQFKVGEQILKLQWVPFWDVGRVWSDWSKLAFTQFHSTVGFSFRLNVNNYFIWSADLGVSPEEVKFLLKFGHPF